MNLTCYTHVQRDQSYCRQNFTSKMTLSRPSEALAANKSWVTFSELHHLGVLPTHRPSAHPSSPRPHTHARHSPSQTASCRATLSRSTPQASPLAILARRHCPTLSQPQHCSSCSYQAPWPQKKKKLAISITSLF